MRALGAAFCLCVAMMACASGCASQDALEDLTQMEEAQESSPAAPAMPQLVVDTPNPLDLPAETVLGEEELAAYGEDACFAVLEISDELFERMSGKTYKAGCTVSRDDLRYVRVLHANAAGEVLTGELVVNVAIADEMCEIFRELYDARYPIERIRLADDYDGVDEASMEDNNSSAFNFRPIEGSGSPSRHGVGMAVDINTLYNPYYRFSDGTVLPVTGAPYLDRSQEFPYKIAVGDLCYRLFTEHGYTWGGHWNSVKDYQHFEK